MTDPTTPEGRTELRRIASDGHPADGHVLVPAAHVTALIDALDDAEAAIARVRALAYSTAVGYSEEERILDALDGDS